MKKGLSLILIALLLFFTLGWATEAVKPEDLKVLETLIDLMSGKIGEYQDQFSDFKGLLGSISGKIGDMESKSEALNQMDQFLWTKIENTEKSLKEQIITGEEQQKTALQDKIWAVNQRLKWIDSGISGLKEEVEAIYTDIYKLGSELSAAGKTEEMISVLDGTIVEKVGFVQSQIDLLYKKIQRLEGEDSASNAAIQQLTSDLGSLKDLIAAIDASNVEAWNAANAGEKADLERVEEINLRLKSAENALMALGSKDTGIQAVIDEMTSDIGALRESFSSMDAGQAFFQSQIDMLYKKIQQLEGKGNLPNEALLQLNSDIGLLKDLIGMIDASNVEAWKAAYASEKTAQDRVEEINLRLKSVENAFMSLGSKDNGIQSFIDEMTADIGVLRESVASMQANDQFLWNKIDIADRQLNESLVNGNEQLRQLLTDKVSALNLRLKWVDSGIEKIKTDMKALNEEILTLGSSLKAVQEKQDASAENYGKLLDDRVWALNKRLTWTDSAVSKLKSDFENQQKKLVEAEIKKQEELGDRLWGVDMRLSWLGTQLYKVKDEASLNQEILGVSVGNLELEIELLKARTQSLELEKALQTALDDMMISKLNDVQDRCAQIEKQLSQLQEDYATKAELSQTNQKIDETAKKTTDKFGAVDVRLKWVDQTLASQKGQLENLKSNLSKVQGELSGEIAQTTEKIEENANKTTDKFSAMDVRLKWVDQTLASQKGQIENLKKNLAEVEGELSDELAERMWAINSRLKWIDGAISKIKTQKADIVEVEANYEAIQGELLGLADDILELAVAIQKNSEEIALTNAGLRKASSDLTQKIDTEKADIQSQIDSMRARLEASISTNRQMIDSNSRKINDLESRVKTLEDTVFKKPENAQPFGIVLLFAGVAALALLFANQ